MNIDEIREQEIKFRNDSSLIDNLIKKSDKQQ